MILIKYLNLPIAFAQACCKATLTFLYNTQIKMKAKGRVTEFISRTLALVSAFSIFSCKEPIKEEPILPNTRDSIQDAYSTSDRSVFDSTNGKTVVHKICEIPALCTPNIKELESGVFNSAIDPTKIDKDNEGNWISSNSIIIRFKDSTSAEDIINLLNQINGQVSHYIPDINFYAIRLSTDSAAEVENIIQQLSSNPVVDITHKNYVAFMEEFDYQSDKMKANPGIWGYERIKIAEAYNYLELHGIERKEVKVAILDSSFDLSHPELKNSFTAGYDFADNDPDPSNSDIEKDTKAWFHGTRVASIVAAENNGESANGVAYDATILPFKISPSNEYSQSEKNIFGFEVPTESITVATALYSAVVENANVINMSFVDYISPISQDSPFSEKVNNFMYNILCDFAHSKGVVLVASAGNDESDASNYYPSSLKTVISVGASDSSDNRATNWGLLQGSNYSKKDDLDILTVAAPGDNIFAPYPDVANPSNKENIRDGTSYAAPFVSGLAALIKSIDSSLTPDEIRDLMVSSADKITVTYPDDSEHTWNRINVLNAVKQMSGETQEYDDTKIKWTMELPTDVTTLAIGTDGTLYVTSSSYLSFGYLYAITPQEDILWKIETDYPILSAPAIGPNNSLYICAEPTGSGVNRELYSLTQDGDIEWSLDVVTASSTPAIANDGTIYTFGHYLHAITPDGEIKWEFETGYNWELSSPAIASDGTIYVGSYSGRFYAVSPDGTLKWKVNMYQNTGDNTWEFNSPAAIGSDDIIYVVVNNYQSLHLYAFDSEGNEKWIFEMGQYSINSAPVVGENGIVYIHDKEFLYAIHTDGTLNWSIKLETFSLAADALSHPTAPAITSDGTIYVGGDTAFYAVSSDGQLQWKSKLTETDAIEIGAPVVSTDGTIYVTKNVAYNYGSDILCAISGTSPLANSPWPKLQHDLQNSGNYSYGKPDDENEEK